MTQAIRTIFFSLIIQLRYNTIYHNTPISFSFQQFWEIVLIYGLDDTWTGADLPEELVEDTILHEMIHYYIAFNHWSDTSTHGQLFRREMKRINEKGGRHISISYRPNPEQLAQLRAKN